MASPQKENGYTPISNELLDAILRTNFVTTQLKLILCCCRYTYGFSRKEAELSESFMCKAIGTSRRNGAQQLRSLIAMKIINVVKESTFTSSRILKLNKNYDEWGYGSTDPQGIRVSTGDLSVLSTGDLGIPSTGDLSILQDKQDKQDIKQDTVVPAHRKPRKTASPASYSAEFEEYWKDWPCKDQKKVAFEMWNKRIARGEPWEDMIKAAQHYFEFCRSDGRGARFWKHPEKFIDDNMMYTAYIDGVPGELVASRSKGRSKYADE